MPQEEFNKAHTRLKEGDEPTKSDLILSNLGLVVKVAKKEFRPKRGFSFEEVVSEGLDGLFSALDNFD
ncbi:MAG: hypothetical protein AABW87_02050 [Nanoarchaeota archaeon]